jgi:cysteine-rich repeat protein
MGTAKTIWSGVGFVFLLGVAGCNGTTTTGGGDDGMCEPGESAPCYTGLAGTDGVGICHAGTQRCNADGLGFGACDGEQIPEVEVCDAAHLDQDCDGNADEEAAICACGDGQLTMGEACDDGNQDSTDSCTSLCKLPTCGDGFIQPSAGEGCDDGGTSDADGCSSTCVEQKVLEVRASSLSTCALLSGGLIKCWGANGQGQLGLGDTDNRGDGPNQLGNKLPTVDLGPGKTATSLVAGDAHFCALLRDGSVKCWGGNNFGQLGLGDKQDRGYLPNQMGDKLPTVDLGTGKIATSLAAATDYTCAILSDGSVKCWGGNGYGTLGLGDTNNRGDAAGEMGDKLPTVDLGSGKTAAAIAVGYGHMCALLRDASVKCWGYGFHGQLGLGDTNNRGDAAGEMGDKLPTVDLGSGKTVTALAAGLYHTCARLSDGSVKCWGGNFNGVLGAGDAANRGDNPGEMGSNLPVVDLGPGKIASVMAASWYHTCAALSDGSVKCWGNNSSGELGLGDVQTRGDGPSEMGNNLPSIDLGMGKTAAALTAGSSHTCARLNDGSVKCWGGNGFGTLGVGSQKNRGDDPGEMGDALPSVKLFSDVW